MKREIKFRAKSINNEFFQGEWVKGYYAKILWNGEFVDVITDGAHEIPIQVDKLGQFTGMRDKNEKEIYEGDILFIGEDVDGKIYNEVGIKDGCFGYIGEINNELLPFSQYNVIEEVVGNTYDNPELLKGNIHE